MSFEICKCDIILNLSAIVTCDKSQAKGPRRVRSFLFVIGYQEGLRVSMTRRQPRKVVLTNTEVFWNVRRALYGKPHIEETKGKPLRLRFRQTTTTTPTHTQCARKGIRVLIYVRCGEASA